MPTPARLPPTASSAPSRLVRSACAVFGLLIAGLVLVAGKRAHAEAPAQGSPASQVAPVSLRSGVSSASTPLSRPTWSELTASQKIALAPLASHWNSLAESHKRKWLAMSRNFNEWPAEEQARVHGRMSAWAGLSTPERDQARTNFAEARKLDRDEKMARWEAYQALSDEQRDRLATTVSPRRPGVAVPAKATRAPAVVKLVPAGGDSRTVPRVGVPASEVDHNTLLPQHPPVP